MLVDALNAKTLQPNVTMAKGFFTVMTTNTNEDRDEGELVFPTLCFW